MNSFKAHKNECVCCGRSAVEDGFCDVHSYEMIRHEWDAIEGVLVAFVYSLHLDRTYKLQIKPDAFEHPRVIGWGELHDEEFCDRDGSEILYDERKSVVTWCRKSTDVMNALSEAFSGWQS